MVDLLTEIKNQEAKIHEGGGAEGHRSAAQERTA